MEIVKKSKAAQELIIQCTPKEAFSMRAYVKEDEQPLNLGDHPTNNTHTFYTSGSYTIKFKPGVPGMEKKPFVFNIDFMPGHRIRIGSYSGLEQIAKKNPKIKWLLKNTNLNAAYFKIARCHRDMPLAFSVNWDQLEKKIRKNGETRKSFLWEVTEDDA